MSTTEAIRKSDDGCYYCPTCDEESYDGPVHAEDELCLSDPAALYRDLKDIVDGLDPQRVGEVDPRFSEQLSREREGTDRLYRYSVAQQRLGRLLQLEMRTLLNSRQCEAARAS